MPISLSDDSLELFLSRARMMSAAALPVYLALVFFFAKEEGWRWSFLAMCLLPPVAAVSGFLAKRDIRPGLGVAAIVMVIAPLPLVGGLEALFSL